MLRCPTFRAVRLLPLALLGLALLRPALAQDEPQLWSGAENAGQALGNLLARCEEARQEGLGWADGLLNIAVARQIPGPQATVLFGAAEGVEYTVYAARDDQAADEVTLDVLDGDGNSLGTHPGDDPLCVRFSCPAYTDVRVGVTMAYSEDAPSTYIAVGFLEQGGVDATPDEFATGFGKLIAAAGALEQELGTELRPHANDQFAIFGAVLPGNQGGRVAGITLEANLHILLSAGDENTNEVSCDFSDGGVESYGYSGTMETVAAVTYTPTELTEVAPMVGGNGERSVMMWMLLDLEANG